MAKPSKHPPSIPQPLVVVGIGRSGTSAFLKAFGEHPEFVRPRVFGEAPFIDKFASFLVEYEDASSIREYNMANYKIGPVQRYRQMSRMIYNLHVVPEDRDQAKSARYWACKTSLRPENFGKFKQLFRDLKVGYIIRNGIEVVNSSRHFEGFKAREFEALCNRWKGSLVRNRFLEDESCCAMVRHQDLVSDSFSTFDELYERIGLSQDNGPPQFIKENVFNSSFSKTQSVTSAADVFKSRLKDAWSAWSSEEQKIFLDICEEEMRRYGFAIPGVCETTAWSQPAAKNPSAPKDEHKEKVTVSASGFEPIPLFDGTFDTLDVVKVDETKLGSRIWTPDANLKKEIDSRLGIAIANYCTHPCKALKLAYFEVPKVACTTLKYLLQSLEMEAAGKSARPFDRPLVHSRGKSNLPQLVKMSPDELSDVIIGESHTRFAIVRDPFTRTLSCYLSKIARPMPQRREILALQQGVDVAKIKDDGRQIGFLEFLDTIAKQKVASMDIHWKPQVDLLMLGLVSYDFIGRYERFGDCLGYLKKQYFPDTKIAVPHATNATNSTQRLGQYYDDRCIEMVQSIYKDDFAILGYDESGDAIRSAWKKAS